MKVASPMACEKLCVPEEALPEVVSVIRAGIEAQTDKVSYGTLYQLEKWCREMDRYMGRKTKRRVKKSV